MVLEVKKEAHGYCEQYIQSRLSKINHEIEKINESLLSESKSTAGDKHETGRAMLQLEREKMGRQLAEIEKMQAIFKKIDGSKKNERIALGSLVRTNSAIYYISISAGRFQYKDVTLFCISAATPIGRLLMGKTVGEEFHFNGNTSKILEID